MIHRASVVAVAILGVASTNKMNRLPFRALTAVTGPPCQLISAQRGARKVARPKRHDELPAGVELHKDRASAVGLLLRRDPVILPEPTPFEAAYAAHCDDLRLEVAKPFATDFYFKKGTSDEQLFRSAQDLLGKSRGAKGEETGAPSESDLEADDASVSGRSATENPYAPYSGPLAPRTTEADASGDVTSLNRALDRTLFLVVKKRGENGKWTLPESSIESTELLHEVGRSRPRRVRFSYIPS